jgi:hypothetical protein
MILNTLGKPFH